MVLSGMADLLEPPVRCATWAHAAVREVTA